MGTMGDEVGDYWRASARRLGEAITRLRRPRTLREVARAMGVGKSTLQRWERGEVRLDLERARRLDDVLDAGGELYRLAVRLRGVPRLVSFPRREGIAVFRPEYIGEVSLLLHAPAGTVYPSLTVELEMGGEWELTVELGELDPVGRALLGSKDRRGPYEVVFRTNRPVVFQIVDGPPEQLDAERIHLVRTWDWRRRTPPGPGGT